MADTLTVSAPLSSIGAILSFSVFAGACQNVLRMAYGEPNPKTIRNHRFWSRHTESVQFTTEDIGDSNKVALLGRVQTLRTAFR